MEVAAVRQTFRENASKTPRVLLAVWPALLVMAALAASVGTSGTAYAALAPAVGGRAVVTNTGGDPIRVRQGAGTQYPQISSVYEGQMVSVLAGPGSDAKGNKWFKVQAASGTGWIMAAFLEGTSAPTASPRKLSGLARVAYTDGDPLRMRVAPTAGPAGKTVTLLDPGIQVGIKAGPLTDSTGVAWYQITAKGLTGWAMAQYLAPVETAQAQVASPSAENAAAHSVPAAPTAPAAASSPTQYRQWMEEARKTYPYAESLNKMWNVMMCESGGNPRASGGAGAWLGLFQYVPGTWAGLWNPYRTSSIWDARAQIFATAKAWSIGMQSAWSCYYKTANN